MAEKRYYWLKLREDFFRQKDIKKLRQIAGGDTYTIIYLKMLLRSLENEGRLYYDGVEDDFPGELALDIDETVENVNVTISYLIARGILVQQSSDEYEITTAAEMTGSETASAERKRRSRAAQAGQSHASLGQSHNRVTDSHTEKEMKEIDIEIEKDTEEEIEGERADKPPRAPRFTPPSAEEVRAYSAENSLEIDADAFIDHYSANGWKVGGKAPMKDWKAAVRNWARHDKEYGQMKQTTGAPKRKWSVRMNDLDAPSDPVMDELRALHEMFLEEDGAE